MDRVRHRVLANPRIRYLRELATLDTRDMQVMTRSVDQGFRANETALFASEGRTGGKAWPSLDPRYAKQKARRWPGRKIMQRSGALRRSLTQKTPDHVADWYLKPRAVIRVGTEVETAAYHIAGSHLKNPHVPARDTLQMTAQQRQGLVGRVTEHMQDKLKRVARALLAGQAEMRARSRARA